MSAPLVEPTRDEFRKFLEEAALYDKLNEVVKPAASVRRLLRCL